jgi:hypothetical protein
MKKILFFILLIWPFLLAQVPSAAADSFSTQTVKQFVDKFWSDWSSPNAVAIPSIRFAIDDPINFYGKPMSRDAYMKIQTAFARRWPDREYSVDVSSEVINCDLVAAKCDVSGIVSWQDSSPDRSAISTGSAKFRFLLREEKIGSTVAYLLASESGSVINRSLSSTGTHGCAVFGGDIHNICQSFPDWTDGLWHSPPGVQTLHVLVVGGGGGGSSPLDAGAGGPGGASGEIVTAYVHVTKTPIEIRIGESGAGSQNFQQGGENGGKSSFGDVAASGGGGGQPSGGGTTGGDGGASGGGGSGGGDTGGIDFQAGSGGSGGTGGKAGENGSPATGGPNPVQGTIGGEGNLFPSLHFKRVLIVAGAGGKGGSHGYGNTGDAQCDGGGGGGGGGILINGTASTTTTSSYNPPFCSTGIPGKNGNGGIGYGAGGGGGGNGHTTTGGAGAAGVVYVEW